MKTRKHIHQESFDVSAEALFAILITPSAICGWWGASTAIVLAEKGGIWAASWGADIDDPDYISTAEIRVCEPPSRLVLKYGSYYSKEGALPFDADFETEFIVTVDGNASELKVTQDGFPADSLADNFYNACEIGWKNTFSGIRDFLERENAPIN